MVRVDWEYGGRESGFGILAGMLFAWWDDCTVDCGGATGEGGAAVVGFLLCYGECNSVYPMVREARRAEY
jgi:hypothetical protein